MAWVKIDDKFNAHPKVLAAGPLGKLLFIDSLCYANQYLTDGFIPQIAARQLAIPLAELCEDIRGVISRLVESGLWSEIDGGFQIHDYLDYNPSKASVLESRESARTRMQTARQSKRTRSTGGDSEVFARSSGEQSPNVRPNFAGSSDNPVPVPVVLTEQVNSPLPPEGEAPTGAPDESDSDETPQPKRRGKSESRGTRFPPDSVLTDEWRDAAIANGCPPHLVQVMFDEFRDYWIGAPGAKGLKADWPATWRNRIRAKFQLSETATKSRPADWRDRKPVLA